MAPDQCAWPRARCDALAPPKCRKRRTPRRRPQTEPPWVWWRLVLLVSNPGGVGLLGSVERCFELGRRDVAAVAVEPGLVEPVHHDSVSSSSWATSSHTAGASGPRTHSAL